MVKLIFFITNLFNLCLFKRIITNNIEYCKDVWIEAVAMGINVGFRYNHILKGNSLPNESICPMLSTNQEQSCCNAPLEAALVKRSVEEVNSAFHSYLGIWPAEMRKLIKLYINWISGQLENVGNELILKTCYNVEHVYKAHQICIQNNEKIFQQVMNHLQKFFDNSLDLNSSRGGEVRFLVDAILTARKDNLINHEETQCFWMVEDALNARITEMHRLFQSTVRQEHFCELPEYLIGRAYLGKPSVDGSWSKPRFITFPNVTESFQVLIKSLVYVREVLQTLRLMEVLMQKLVDYDLGTNGCDAVLMRMRHCALCSGHPSTYPCPALCDVSVARCLMPLLKLRPAWKDVIGILIAQIKSWKINPNKGLVLQIYQSPMAFFELFKEIMFSIHKTLPSECSSMFNSGLSISTVRSEFMSRRSKTLIKDTSALDRILLKLQHLNSLWIDVSSSICRESPHFSSSVITAKTCWNGTAIGQFSNIRETTFDEDKTQFHMSWFGQSNQDDQLSLINLFQFPKSTYLSSDDPMTTLIKTSIRTFHLNACKLKLSDSGGRPSEARLSGKSDSGDTVSAEPSETQANLYQNPINKPITKDLKWKKIVKMEAKRSTEDDRKRRMTTVGSSHRPKTLYFWITIYTVYRLL